MSSNNISKNVSKNMKSKFKSVLKGVGSLNVKVGVQTVRTALPILKRSVSLAERFNKRVQYKHKDKVEQGLVQAYNALEVVDLIVYHRWLFPEESNHEL